MTKQNKQRLLDHHYKLMSIKYPNFPKHAIPGKTWSDNSANGLTKCVIDLINYEGYQAERISTQGTYVEGAKIKVGENERQLKGKYIPTQGTKGSADISATIRGRSVKIEIKYGKDRQSDVQREYQESIERAGGIYIIVRNFDEFVEWFDLFIKNN
jgi:hypothetical protein